MIRKLILATAILVIAAGGAAAQSVRYQGQLIGSRGLPLANQNVAVCTQPATTSTQPCSPLATLATSNATSSGGANPLTTDVNGNFFFYIPPGRYLVQAYGPQVSGQFLQADTEIFCSVVTTTCSFTGTITFNVFSAGQINSTGEINQSETNGGATGSPNFDVFGGDVNRHCATISENNIPGGTPACLAAGQYYTPSAATTNSVSPTTMVTVDGTTGNTYRLSAYVDQTVLGASCAGNSTVVVNVIFQDPNAAAPQTQAIGTFTVTTNGTLGIVPLTTAPGTLLIRAKTATNVQYSATYTPNGACSPAPTYQVFPILEKVN